MQCSVPRLGHLGFDEVLCDEALCARPRRQRLRTTKNLGSYRPYPAQQNSSNKSMRANKPRRRQYCNASSNAIQEHGVQLEGKKKETSVEHSTTGGAMHN